MRQVGNIKSDQLGIQGVRTGGGGGSNKGGNKLNSVLSYRKLLAAY